MTEQSSQQFTHIMSHFKTKVWRMPERFVQRDLRHEKVSVGDKCVLKAFLFLYLFSPRQHKLGVSANDSFASFSHAYDRRRIESASPIGQSRLGYFMIFPLKAR